MQETIRIRYYHSPCGEIILGSYGDKLCLCDWNSRLNRNYIDERIKKYLGVEYKVAGSEITEKAATQLDEYFNRKRTTFDIPLLLQGTAFQKSVWNELQNIPYGTTISYAVLSARLKNPKAIRAVAAANGANAISIFIPCHRVIGSNNKLVGYAGGVEAKQQLLELELPVNLSL